MRAKQAKFLELFREYRDLPRAWKEAGYTGSEKSAYKLLRKLGESDTAIINPQVKADRIAQAIVPVVPTDQPPPEPEHYVRLRTKQGRQEWLMDFIAGKIEIVKQQVYFDQEGQRQVDEVISVPDFKERAKAMELLQKSCGDQSTTVDVKGSVDVAAVTKPRPVYIHVDNGRGPALPISGSTTGQNKMEVCACGAVYESGSTHECEARVDLSLPK